MTQKYIMIKPQPFLSYSTPSSHTNRSITAAQCVLWTMCCYGCLSYLTCRLRRLEMLGWTKCLMRMVFPQLVGTLENHRVHLFISKYHKENWCRIISDSVSKRSMSAYQPCNRMESHPPNRGCGSIFF